MNVSATDNVGVTKAELYVNGALFATEASQPFVFSWDTSAVADGPNTLEARAYDAAGNVGASGSLGLAVRNAVDLVPPAVFITTPATGVSLTGQRKTTITAKASDNNAISRMELYIDGLLKSSISGSSISYSWNLKGVSAGSHSISVKAYDSSNNTTASAITVKL